MILKRQVIIIAILVAVALILAALLEAKFKTVFTVLATLVGACVVLFIYRRLMPVLCLKIEPHWTTGTDGLVILSVTIQNTGHLVAKMKEAWVQILEYNPPNDSDLYSEYVPLTEKLKRSGEKNLPWKNEHPLEWKDMRPVLGPTQKVEAGESINVDFLYNCPRHAVAHFLVQFKAELDPITRYLYESPSTPSQKF